jgi:serine O-acetyltransferase
VSFGETLRRDIERSLEGPVTPVRAVSSVLWSRGVQAVFLYRIGHWLWQRHLWVGSAMLLRLSEVLYGVDIAYEASIGPGLVLRHPSDVVIGKKARIGRDVTIFNGVTLGNRLSGSAHRPDGMPTIEDQVLLGTGAKILGPVVVGTGSVVGANAVVTRSVPAGSTVGGCGARVLGKRSRLAASAAIPFPETAR